MGGNIDMWEEYGNTRKLDNLIAGHLIAPIEAGWLAHSPSYQFCRLNLGLKPLNWNLGRGIKHTVQRSGHVMSRNCQLEALWAGYCEALCAGLIDVKHCGTFMPTAEQSNRGDSQTLSNEKTLQINTDYKLEWQSPHASNLERGKMTQVHGTNPEKIQRAAKLTSKFGGSSLQLDPLARL